MRRFDQYKALTLPQVERTLVELTRISKNIEGEEHDNMFLLLNNSVVFDPGDLYRLSPSEASKQIRGALKHLEEIAKVINMGKPMSIVKYAIDNRPDMNMKVCIYPYLTKEKINLLDTPADFDYKKAIVKERKAGGCVNRAQR